MADIYDRAYAMAARMLAPRSAGGKGLEATLTKVVPGAYDPATGTSTPTLTTYAGSAFRDTYSREEIDGTRVLVDDDKFLVSPELINGDATPMLDPQFKITFDGVEYTIVNVKPWNYAGLTVGFEVQGRK